MPKSDDVTLSENLKKLIFDDVNSLGLRLFRLVSSCEKFGERPEILVRQLLMGLDGLHYELESLRSLVAMSALSEGFAANDISWWLGVPKGGLDQYAVSEWNAAQIAAAKGEKCPGDGVESREAYNLAQQVIERDYARTSVENLAHLLALLYVPDYEVDMNPWLEERIARAIKQGWHIQPKRAQPSSKTDKDETISPALGAAEAA